MNLKTPGVEGYEPLRYCPNCGKETIHFITVGEGCKAYICRNYEHHILAQNTLKQDARIHAVTVLPRAS